MTKQTLFKIGAVLLGFGILTLLEVGLRGADYPPEISVTTPRSWGDGVKLVPSGSRKTYLIKDGDRIKTSGMMKADRFMLDHDFSVDPVPDTTRIFTFGGSAALGVPIEREQWRTFSGRLHSHLKKGGMSPEVINLAGASFGTDQVLELASLAINWGPKALVVYSGNNEFFNYNLELYQLNQNYTLNNPLLGLNIFKLLNKKTKIKSIDPQKLIQSQEEIIAQILEGSLRSLSKDQLPIIENGKAQRRDPHFNEVIKRYHTNLEDLAKLAETSNIMLYIVEIPTHLLHPPELSLHKPGANPNKVKQLIAKKELERALEIDPFYAQTWYELGKVETDPAKATLYLQNAAELDMSPGRPVEQMRLSIKKISHKNHVKLVEVPDLSGIEAHSYFADACHLTAEGQDKLAKAVATAILEDQ